MLCIFFLMIRLPPGSPRTYTLFPYPSLVRSPRHLRVVTPPSSPPRQPDPHGFKRRGVLFVLSSPSGAGKSTIARKLLAAHPELGVSVSATTRPIRPGAVDGEEDRKSVV